MHTHTIHTRTPDPLVSISVCTHIIPSNHHPWRSKNFNPSIPASQHPSNPLTQLGHWDGEKYSYT